MRRRIINFHGLGEPKRLLEPGEADYWLSLDRFHEILDRISCHPYRDVLSITFDDGNVSDSLLAAPELQRRGLTADFFVLTGRIGEVGSMSADDLRALGAMGMRIGSHGTDHRNWSLLPPRQLYRELHDSKERLEEICGQRIRSASIPFGRYNAAVLSGLREAGYESVYSSDGGDAEISMFLKPRTSIRRGMTDSILDQVLCGHMPIWKRARRAARMTIRSWAL